MRRASREIVFKLLFEYSFQNEKNDQTKDLMLMDSDMTEEDKEYIEKTYYGVVDNIETIKKTLADNITGYTLDRIYRSDLVILEMAAYEISEASVPQAVVINEAVDLAKKYGTDKSGGFVNAVLAKLAK